MRSYLLITILLFVSTAWTAPLTIERLQSITKVAVYTGTFDPPTESHKALAEAAIKAGMDAVIVLPNHDTLHKNPIPTSDRLEMWHLVAGDSDKILYPKDGVFLEAHTSRGYISPAFTNFLKDINPNLEIHVLGGEDILKKTSSTLMLDRAFSPKGWISSLRYGHQKVDTILGRPVKWVDIHHISASKIRRAINKNVHLHFADRKERLENMPAGVDERVWNYLLDRGVYISRPAENTIDAIQLLKRFIKNKFKSILFKFNFYERYKKIYVTTVLNTSSKPVNLKHINGEPLTVIKNLGAGMSAVGYLVKLGEEKVVLKWAHGSETTKSSVRRAVRTHMWIAKKTTIRTPELINFDKNGRWLLAEFIHGKSLEEILKKRTLNNSESREIDNIFKEARRVLAESHTHLDIAPDNIIFKNGKAYLIDLGPIESSATKLKTARDQMKVWEEIYRYPREQYQLQRKISPSCKKLFLN